MSACSPRMPMPWPRSSRAKAADGAQGGAGYLKHARISLHGKSYPQVRVGVFVHLPARNSPSPAQRTPRTTHAGQARRSSFRCDIAPMARSRRVPAALLNRALSERPLAALLHQAESCRSHAQRDRRRKALEKAGCSGAAGPGYRQNRSAPRRVKALRPPDMPEFKFDAGDVGAIIAWLKSIQQR